MSKVLVVGLDGFNFRMIEHLRDRGVFSAVGDAVDEGYAAPLRSTTPPFTMPAWTSLMTGKNPGKHGVISFFERNPDQYHVEPPTHPTVSSRSIQSETIWDVFSQEGVNHTVVNLPVTYPPESADHRTMISGMMTPSDSDDFYTPNDIADIVENYVVDYFSGEKETFSNAINIKSKGGISIGKGFAIPGKRANHIDQEDFLRQSGEMARSRAETSKELAKRKDWDVLMPVFTSTDRLSHYFWDYFEGKNEYGGRMDTFYAELDSYIEELLELVDLSEDYVLFVSDHGFGKSPRKVVALNRILAQEGLLNTSTKPGGANGILAQLHQRRVIRNLGKSILPQKIQNRLKGEIVGGLTELIDWGETKAYATPMYSSVIGVEINRKGVKQQGIVSDDEYPEVREEVANICRGLTDPATDKSVVKEVRYREDVYHGNRVESLPDLIITLKEQYDLTTLLEEEIIGEKASPKIGDHREDGIFVLLGPDVRTARINQPHDIIDVAPTLSYLSGVPQNEDFDGSIVTDAFEQQVATQPTEDFSELNVHSGSVEDSESVRKRLEDLGYM